MNAQDHDLRMAYVYQTELDRLYSENERFRTALEVIAGMREQSWAELEMTDREIAREAVYGDKKRSALWHAATARREHLSNMRHFKPRKLPVAQAESNSSLRATTLTW